MTNYNERERQNRPDDTGRLASSRRSVSLCRAATDDVTQLLNPASPLFPNREQRRR